MNIQITNEAAKWYKSEMLLKDGDKIRFFVRYGGHSTVHRGFSLGVEKEEPFDMGASATVEGITFFIEEKDLWYFSDHDLLVHYNAKIDEPEFEFETEQTR
ncbi:HesB/YadR/YfhF family protein [Neobacillus sp. D3-1R]|uniref:HesB/YadR/YfhF family protein n=1 Tax=Neobacillus sp. D3-1R TaxID=3445778 RepID=UPI003FA0DDC0